MFAVCMMNRETKEDFFNIFKGFFQIIGGKPETIITDQQMAMIGALKDLAQEEIWNGSHLFDTYHVLKNLRKKTKNSQLISHLRDAMFANTYSDYQ